MPLSFETLRIIWWILLGVLLIGFAIMDGFDLGVAMWLPWGNKKDVDRRILINSIGPTWEGNQVWFVLGGGAIFAAWPALYGLAFSGFYFAMLIVLLALILRPVGFKYRSKVNHGVWRACWDWSLFVSGIVPALIFGVAIGNVLQGVPFNFDDNLRAFYTGNFFGLLNPFAILCGVLSISMLAMHGAFFLQIKTTETIQKQALARGRICSMLSLGLFIAGGIWLYTSMSGYTLTSIVPHDGPSNPLYKTVIRQTPAWFANYYSHPLTIVAPALGIISLLLALLFSNLPIPAFICSACSIFGIIATVGVSMFPFILPSSTHPNHSLLVWDASSSQLTLFIMLFATVVFLPIILLYTAWVYRVLSGKVTAKTIKEQHETAY